MKLKHLVRSAASSYYRRAHRSFRDLPRIQYRAIVDAGAYRGSFTDAFLEVHSPDRVLLVEPTPESAERLRTKYRNRRGIEVAEVTLSGSSGAAEFDINRWSGASSLLPIDPRNRVWFDRDLDVAEKVAVKTVSLPELLDQYGFASVDLLKLDLQGAEGLVLEAAVPALSRIKVLYVEVFFESLYNGAWLFPDLWRFLTAQQFKLCGLVNIAHGRNGDLLQANAIFHRLS